MIDISLKARRYFLLAGDLILLYVSLWLTLLVRYQSVVTIETWKNHIAPFTIVFFMLLVVFYINDLYELEFVKGNILLINKLITGLTIGGISASTFFYFGYNTLFTIRPQTVLFINLIMAFFLLYAWRHFFFRYMRSPKRANNVLIFGMDPLMLEIIKKINKQPQLGFAIKSIGINEHAADELKKKYKLPKVIPVFYNANELKDNCIQHNINSIISVINVKEDIETLKNFFSCLSLKINFYDAPNFYEKITGKIPVKNIGHIWFLENLTESTKKTYEASIRLLDIVFAIVLLLMSLPFVPLIALAIKLDSRGPIVFKQKRLGHNGIPFVAMKFRTMHIGAEKNGPQWATKNDPRVTKIGAILRKTRIDEIPQLINILIGEMSLVGPRPERPEFIETLQKEIPFYKERLLVKPGLTGWAQVMGPAYGGSVEETLEKLQYDLFYIKNRSLGLDVSILLKTIKTVLSSKGQ